MGKHYFETCVCVCGCTLEKHTMCLPTRLWGNVSQSQNSK